MPPPSPWAEHTAPRIRAWWAVREAVVYRFVLPTLALLAALKLGDEYRRLLLETGPTGAIDLRILHSLVTDWFQGAPIYDFDIHAVYPPASYLLLWPLLGWLSADAARWLWAGLMLAALAGFCGLLIRGSNAASGRDRVFVALLLLSMNATGVCVGNGQLAIFMLPAVVGAVLVVRRQESDWRYDVLVSFLALFALLKPSLSAPFMFLLLMPPGGWRRALLIGLGYAGLTLASSLSQAAGPWALMQDWLNASKYGPVLRGYGNVHTWLSAAGHEDWALPASALALLALGIWTLSRRHTDVWISLAVAALAARFWIYHRLYDDMLIVLPMVALYRLARGGPRPEGRDVLAGVLLAATILAMLMPARLLRLPAPALYPFTGTHVVLWLGLLWFLLGESKRQEQSAPAEERQPPPKAGEPEILLAPAPDAPDALRFSIVIATLNRPRPLARCLEALTQLDYPRARWELVVVDDGGATDLTSVVAAFQSRMRVTLARMPGQSGPAAARNAGIHLARGKYLAFTDDDAEPEPGWLKALEAGFKRHPSSCLGGRTLNALRRNPYAAASQLLVSHLYEQFNADPDDATFFTGNNMAFPAERLREINGFDSRAMRAAGEDRELCDRWRRHGYRMRYIPEAIVWHSHEMGLRGFWRQHFNYGCGAYFYHWTRARLSGERLQVEGPGFYAKLVWFPFTHGMGLLAPVLSTLMVLSQVANALGFFWERQCQAGAPVSSDPDGEPTGT